VSRYPFAEETWAAKMHPFQILNIIVELLLAHLFLHCWPPICFRRTPTPSACTKSTATKRLWSDHRSKCNRWGSTCTFSGIHLVSHRYITHSPVSRKYGRLGSIGLRLCYWKWKGRRHVAVALVCFWCWDFRAVLRTMHASFSFSLCR